MLILSKTSSSLFLSEFSPRVTTVMVLKFWRKREDKGLVGDFKWRWRQWRGEKNRFRVGGVVDELHKDLRNAILLLVHELELHTLLVFDNAQ